jgi:uroporphyrinogen III methyltransferase/synthase
MERSLLKRGKVFLIGAGPGDPGLLTLKGKRWLSAADVVVYDALVAPQLLDWTKPGAMRIFVGKRGSHHAMEQREINELLVRHAQRGRVVARLKGGDPFLFGRGGEEAATLFDHGVSFEVIPGVTSVSGVSCYAGIPLTDRRLSSMVTLVTGHEGVGKTSAPVEWSRVSRAGTLVIFMGVDQLEFITERLQRHLWEPHMPAAIIRWGSTPQQALVEGTLSDIAAKARAAKMTAPALVIIGKVVSLRKHLRWFDTKPLFGKKIVITRATEQARDFAELLEEAGAEVIPFPTIQLMPPENWKIADTALRHLDSFDWVLFTSVNGVSGFFNRLRSLGGDVRDLKGVRLGAIGPKTSARVSAYGLKVDVFPDEYRAEALADRLGKVQGQKILLARAQEARDILPQTLELRGAHVTVAPMYRTIKTRKISLDVKKRLLAGDIDAVTFTSSSTVDGFMRHFSTSQRRRLFERTKAAAIGPITAATLRDHQVRPAIRATRYTTEALAKAIVHYFTK